MLTNEIGAGISIAGLVFDIVGVGLIFKFGLPPSVSRGGTAALLLEENDARESDKAALFDVLGSVGLFLLIIGFAAQAIGTSTIFW